jgi:hypothetical protein
MKDLNQAIMVNPRNCYQNYNVAVNGSERTIHTYLGVLGPGMQNATYCSAGQLSPLLNEWSERPAPSDARHVETFLDLHPETARRGYVVCRCPTRQNLSDRVIALPWNVF